MRAPRRPARPPAWDQLAGDLGIELPPAPPVPIQPAAGALPQAAVEGESVAESPSEATELAAKPPEDFVAAEVVVAEEEIPMPVWEELEPSATEPESFEPQEALDIMDETADEFGDEESEGAGATSESASGRSGDEDSAREERRPRRRRRRRGRGRGRDDGPAAEAHAAEQSGEELAGAESVSSEGMESDADDALRDRAEEDRPGDERTERRGRRRRRGRGRDQVRDEAIVGKEGTVDDDELSSADAEIDFDRFEEDGSQEGGAEEDAVDAEAQGEDDDSEHEDDGEHDFDGDEDDDEDGGESPRIGFRNIPTWQDAIGVMIAKNMESRTRNPGGSRGPGGRGGRGGGRGGRGRRPDRR